MLAFASPAQAQADPPQPSGQEEIVVVGERLRGQIDAAQAPIATYNEAEIQALGAGSVGELLGKISPQTGTGRGRGEGGPPVVLVNGMRVSNFRELRNFPPEAIRRIEVLPEEVALRFGYPPDTRLINLILKDQFRSRSAEFSYALPTLGGFETVSGESSLTRISGPARLSVTANANHTSPLFEAERALVVSPDRVPSLISDPQPADYRSLVSRTTNLGLNLVWTRGFGKDGLGGSMTLSAAVNRADTSLWQGLNLVRLTDPGGSSALRSVPGALMQDSKSTTVQAGAAYNTRFSRWQLNATLDFSHGENRVATDRRADTSGLVDAALAGTLAIFDPLPPLPSAGRDQTDTATDRLEGLVTLTGPLARLPGGDLTSTFKAGVTLNGIEGSDTRFALIATSLHRSRVQGGINLAIPLTSRREGFHGGLGDLTLNLSAELHRLSDFGVLTNWSGGLTWALTRKFNLQASYIVNDAAPSISQLASPANTLLNVPVYDFTRAETALVAIISGGNPLLRQERQRDLKLGLNWQVPLAANSNLIIEYFRNRSNDVTAAFPLLTPEVEAAFPGRVTRGVGGNLIAIDQRWITFSAQHSARLRSGLNLSGGLGKAEPGRGGGGMMGMFGGGGGGRGRGGMGPGRWSLGVFHTVQFENRVMLAPSGPVLDLLGGDALSAGGTPRHGIEFNGNLFYKGIGAFVQGSWKAPTTISGSGLPGTSDLRFGSVTNVNLSLFADFSMRPRLIKQVPFLKGARLTLRIDNLLGSRQEVRDASGEVPLSYQQDFLDPRGRMVTVLLRKTF